MAEKAEGTFDVTSWDEQPVSGLDDETVSVTRAHFGQRFAGRIDAETLTDTVMAYRDDGTADYVGFQRVVGKVDGRAGSFVLRLVGAYDGSEARGATSVVPGSATGELAGLRGTGTNVAAQGSEGVYTLDYDIE